nr:MAG TPA: hypothetical protein [Caudoviricetes sp.]
MEKGKYCRLICVVKTYAVKPRPSRLGIKSKQNFDFKELCKGLLASPLRIRLD